ncbi:MAG: Flagellin A [Planctomycetes bacterium ADurb.Bin412]|nr:MAG: Flagellin A [Planctomycetes bacterium ADurb.Bin412]
MARINTNIPAISAQVNLARSTRDMNSTLQRLSSGLRINRGADDPAGLIASESLRSEMASITQAIDNTQRASNVIATAEGALSEVAQLLVDIKELVVEAANRGALSDEEIRANQLQVDSAIDSITRIANSTTFAGLHLLNGNLAYVTSGVATSAVGALDIYCAQLADQDYLAVKVSGVLAAQRGALYYHTSAVDNSVTLEIASSRGVEVFNFTSGFSVSNMLSAINAVTGATGVSAFRANGTDWTSGIGFRSVDYGSDAYISVRALPSSNGTFDVVDEDGTTTKRDAGRDVQAVINGTTTVGSGQEITLNSSSLDLRIKLDSQFGAGSMTTFAITGGGAMFQLGAHINTSEQTNIGINSVVASQLGSTTNGYLNEVATGGAYSLVGGQTASAARIVEEAIQQISVLRGRLGAFERNTLDTNMNSLRITLENVTASESTIRDSDFAVETANLTRSQILVNAGTSVLALANQTPQSVLALLQ